MASNTSDPQATPATDGEPGTEALLSVENLRTVFETGKETIHAVGGVSLNVERGETVGVVGESGSGKTVMTRSVMGLIESPGRIVEGSIKFEGRELTELSESQYRDVRGSGIAMVFQDPLTSLNPVYTVGNQIKEALRIHQGLRGREATEHAVDLLEDVGIPDARRRVDEYPHQFSGGMRQRAVIAMALACDPELLICDEPTTALDVTIQAQILELLDELQEERDLAIMFITHDMGVIAEVSDRVKVMYAGEIVESAPVSELFHEPRHPYTRGLLNSIPGSQSGQEPLQTIEGEVPKPNSRAGHCRFEPRCPEAFEACRKVHPASVLVNEETENHTAACLLYPEDMEQNEAVDRHQEQAEQGDSTLADEGDVNGGEQS